MSLSQQSNNSSSHKEHLTKCLVTIVKYAQVIVHAGSADEAIEKAKEREDDTKFSVMYEVEPINLEH